MSVSILGLLLLLVPATVLLGGLFVLFGVLRKGRPVGEEPAVLLARYGGAVLGLICGALFTGLPSIAGFDLRLGRGLMLAPIVFGLFLLGGIVVGELVSRVPAPQGSRTASLAPRRLVDYLPSAYGIALATITLCAIALLAFTTLTASPDDLGHAGRTLANTCGAITTARGPYPGSYYSVPLLIGMACATALAGYAARRAVQRPRGDLPTLGAEYLRRRSVTAVAGGLGLAITAPTIGIAAFSSMALLPNDCAPGWQHAVGLLTLILMLASVAVFAWSLGVLTFAGALADRQVEQGRLARAGLAAR